LVGTAARGGGVCVSGPRRAPPPRVCASTLTWERSVTALVGGIKALAAPIMAAALVIAVSIRIISDPERGDKVCVVSGARAAGPVSV
jgi:hypothetical protein